MQRAPQLFERIPVGLPSDRGDLEKMQTLTPAVWLQAFRAVVSNAEIQRHYPGIEKKLVFDGADAMEGEESPLLPVAVPETADPLTIIKVILEGIAAIAVLGGTILLAIAGLIATIVGVAMALGVVIAALGIVAVIILSILGILLLGVALVAVVAALIIGIIILVRGSLAEIEEVWKQCLGGGDGRFITIGSGTIGKPIPS